jgi:O-antigen ligase
VTQSDYAAQRRDASNIGRQVGIVFGAKAVANSPIIGYGSWGASNELAALHRESLVAVAGPGYNYPISGSTSGVHSQTLQAWTEGGILGAVFFIIFGWQLLRNFKQAVLLRPLDALSPIILYFYLYSPWHLVMSAFSAPIRLFIAFGAVSVVIVDLERRALRTRPV